MRACIDAAQSLRRAVALLCLVLALGALPARAAIRDDIGRALHEQGITGAVWATLENGAVRTDAAGEAVRGTAMRPDHRVQVGSIAKLVLATGVLRLVSEGRLSLDTPIEQLLPDLALDNPWTRTHPVRVRHLLDHTAGLDDMRLAQFFSLKATPDMPLAQATDIGQPLVVRSRPGSRFSYSNTGYALLGRVIERITGRRYEDYLDHAVLAPIGLHESTFGFVSQTGAYADPRLAMGHFERGMAQPAVAIPLRPAAQFTTTAGDMMRFAEFLMSDGRIGGAAFIDDPLMRARGLPRDTDAARAGLQVGYALGLALYDRHGAVGLCHGGDTVGFRAMLCVFPEHRRAFFIAFNADVEGADYGRIRAMLVDALGVGTNAAPVAARVPADLDDWTGFYVPSPNRFASFAYLDTLFGVVRVMREEAGLRLWSLQRPSVPLTPAGGHLFRAPGRVLPSHALLLADAGARVLVDDRQSYERVSAVRLGLLWISLGLGVAGLSYVLVVGTWRLLRRRPWRDDALRLPWVGVVALALPVALFLRQSFLQLGDLTPASVSLAIVTALLPATLLIALGRLALRGRAGIATRDAAMLLAALQWLAVLAAWGHIPMRTWAL